VKILLDENLPKRLKFRLLDQGHEAYTAREMGWNGQKNGALLGLLTFNGFDVLITSDRNLVHQQNLNKFSVNVILLKIKTNRYPNIQSVLPKLVELLDGMPTNQFMEIEADS
jgi:predicted nuclease of predicted toxin-antitoxin system